MITTSSAITLKTNRERIFQIVLGAILLVWAFAIIVPLLYVLAVSFTHAEAYVEGKFILWPERWSIDAYRFLLSAAGFWRAAGASVFITVVGTGLTLIVTSSFSYVLTKRIPGRDIVVGMVLFTMLFSPGLIPNYLFRRSIGLIDSWFAIILPALVQSYSIFVLRTFFLGLPDELEDSAKIDGCNDLQVFYKIVLPLSKAPLAAFGLFFAVGFWNTYTGAIVYIRDATKWPLQVILQQNVMLANASRLMDTETATQLEMMEVIPPAPEILGMASLVLVSAPIIAVYPFLQKYFTKGVLIGSVKG